MHYKFALIDGLYLIKGSFNWTRSALLRGLRGGGEQHWFLKWKVVVCGDWRKS